jgi:NAD(P)-dependent dehydrogenase (short-subunit alcohol dehydrogenase family)
MDLQGKVAVVTGAGSGIGRALSHELASRGAIVAVCDLNEVAAKDTADGLPRQRDQAHQAFSVDVSDEASVHRLVDEVDAAFGHVDVLVNNAGVLGKMAPVDELSTKDLEWVIGIDLWGVIHGTRAFLPLLKERPEAALVNVSSLAGLMGSLGNAAYFVAKFGVRGFSEAVRAELQPTGVRVTIVFPGIVRTSFGASQTLESTEEERAEAIRRYNAQPGVTPERAARKIANGITKGKARVLIGPDVWALDKLVRLVPGNTDRFLHGFVAKMVNKQQPDGAKRFD